MYRVFLKYLVLMILNIGACGNGWSQDPTSDKIIVFEGIDRKYLPKPLSMDSLSVLLVKKNVIGALRKDGFWLASIENETNRNDTVIVQLFQGRKFGSVKAVVLNEGELESKTPRHMRLNKEKLKNLSQLNNMVEGALKQLENNGYPFASLELESPKIEGEDLKVDIRFDPGIMITYDSLVVSPPGIIDAVFLSRYLGLEYGQSYSEKEINQVQSKSQNLPFMALKEIMVSYQLKKAKIVLDIEPQKVNRFNGLLGVLPSRDGDGLEITGELNLSLNNLFRSGKKVEINWVKLDPSAQQLNAHYFHPILLGTPLDFNFTLDQIRQDTSYTNRSLQLGFDYRPSGHWLFSLSYESLLGNALKNQDDLSGDFDINYYGLQITRHQLDNLINPRKGYLIQAATEIGRKTISNQTRAESTQYRLQAKQELYLPIRTRSVIYLANKSGIIFNDDLYLNDLFRLGGLNSIRGFNEFEFFASKYTLVNAEWRYYLDNQSYLAVFYDQSFMSYEIFNGSFDDRPAAIGLGMQFDTERGNFNILYGLGKRSGENFSFDTSKIHFGYTAIF